ncbi:hypothetical protein RHGRI_007561 [Rhododendron griersonianum]|uniref:Uncharacterized protein n=1 Tax=Rhododendron griersonianum TaxID=479676 RepID=A0AAV6KY20_9ERIC|nr:hypothetical protein RHGRI_007561 [Rhododendron griersonianum]
MHLRECLHDQQLLHRSIDAAHLMVDSVSFVIFFLFICVDKNVQLFNFAMVVGGGLVKLVPANMQSGVMPTLIHLSV